MEACERTQSCWTMSSEDQEDQGAQRALACSRGPERDFGGREKKERQPEAVIKHNNVPHKGTKSGEVLKDTYQFPISAIILSSHTVLARGNCSSPL